MLTFITLFLGLFLLVVWLLIALIIYFLPIIIAYLRKHKNILSIGLLTLFLGWTFFGWLAAILWSLNSDTLEQCGQD